MWPKATSCSSVSDDKQTELVGNPLNYKKNTKQLWPRASRKQADETEMPQYSRALGGPAPHGDEGWSTGRKKETYREKTLAVCASNVLELKWLSNTLAEK